MGHSPTRSLYDGRKCSIIFVSTNAESTREATKWHREITICDQRRRTKKTRKLSRKKFKRTRRTAIYMAFTMTKPSAPCRFFGSTKQNIEALWLFLCPEKVPQEWLRHILKQPLYWSGVDIVASRVSFGIFVSDHVITVFYKSKHGRHKIRKFRNR